MSYTSFGTFDKVVQEPPGYFTCGYVAYPECSIYVDRENITDEFATMVYYAIARGYVKVVMNKLKSPDSIEEAALRVSNDL